MEKDVFLGVPKIQFSSERDDFFAVAMVCRIIQFFFKFF
jgi:hypothetical protein